MGKEIDKIKTQRHKGTEAQSIIKMKRDALNFISRIKGFQIEEAIIFGSRIRGDYLKDSDLDLILVSSNFSGIQFTDRMT